MPVIQNIKQSYNQKVKPSLKAYYGPALLPQEQIRKEQGVLTGPHKELYDATAAQIRNMSYERWAHTLANVPVNLRQSTEQTLKEVGKYGIPLYTVTHPEQALVFLNYLKAAAPGLAIPGLIGAYYVYKKAKELEYKYQLSILKTSPEYYLQQVPARYISHYLRKYTAQGIGGAVVQPLGYTLGLVKNFEVDTEYPGIRTIRPTFRPAYGFRRNYANFWERIGDKGKLGLKPKIGVFSKKKSKFIGYKPGFIGLSFGQSNSPFRVAALRLARKKRERGGLNPLAIIFGDLLMGFFGGALVAWLERTTMGMVATGFIRGVGAPALKALASPSTLGGGYLGHQIIGGPEVKLPFGLKTNIGGLIGAGGGWHYQTLANIAGNQSITGLRYLQITQGAGSSLAESVRYNAVPRAWQIDPHSSTAVQRLINEGYVKEIPGSSPIYDPSNIQVRALNARWLPQLSDFATFSRKGFLRNLPYNTITRPAKFMFRHSWARLPIAGLAISQLLGFPLASWQTAAVCAIDWGLQASKGIPAFQSIKNMGLAGGVAGMQIAILTGGSPIAGALIGASIGASSGFLQSFGRLSIPVASKTPFAMSFEHYWKGGEGKYLWDLNRPFQALTTRYIQPPTSRFKLINQVRGFKASTGKRFFGFLDAKTYKSNWFKPIKGFFKSFRYAKGASTGFVLGTSMAFLLSFLGININPYLAGGIGAAAGTSAQFLWNNLRFGRQGGKIRIGFGNKLTYGGYRTMAERWFGRGRFFARWSARFGKYALKPLGGFLSGVDLTSFIINAFQGIFPQGIMGWAGVGFGLLGGGAAIAAAVAGSFLPVIAFGVGIAAEIITRLVFHRSFFGVIFSKIKYGLAAAGKAIPNIVGAVFGFVLGIFQMLTARSTDQMATGAVMATMSFATLGTTVAVVFIIGSAMFTPLEKSLYLSAEFTNIDKSVKFSKDSLQFPDGSSFDQIKYRYFFHYDQEYDGSKKPVTDGDVPGALTSVAFTDTYNVLKFGDIRNIAFIGPDNFWNEGVVDTINDPDSADRQALMQSKSDYQTIKPHSAINNQIVITLNRPLAEILADGKPLCNIFQVKGWFPSASVQLSTQTSTCINKDGQIVAPPGAQYAIDLVRGLRHACGCQEENSSCPIDLGCISDPSLNPENSFVTYMEKRGYDYNKMTEVWSLIFKHIGKNIVLQCVGFVQAHQLGIATTLACPPGQDCDCASDFANSSNSHIFHDVSTEGYAGIQPGDLVVFGQRNPGSPPEQQGHPCGHIAVVIEVLGDNNIVVAEAHGNDGTIQYDKQEILTEETRNYLGYLTLK